MGIWICGCTVALWLVNLWMETAYMPHNWDKTVVDLIHKTKSNKNKCKNNSGITWLNAFGKMAEFWLKVNKGQQWIKIEKYPGHLCYEGIASQFLFFNRSLENIRLWESKFIATYWFRRSVWSCENPWITEHFTQLWKLVAE